MQRILVTGSATLLGSHLCEELLARGNTVLGADCALPEQRPQISHLLANSRFHCLQAHRDYPLLMALDEVYHLPCPAPPGEGLRSLEAHLQEAEVMLALATRTRASLLHVSVHDGQASDLEEGQAAVASLFLAEPHPSRIRVARVFNAYGPRMLEGDGLLPQFLARALRGEAIAVPGGDPQTPGYCYVDDLVAGLITLMATPLELSTPVDLGNPAPCSVAELARTILRQTGSRSPIVQAPALEPTPCPALPKLAIAQEALAWQPKVSLEDGLRWTLDHLRWLQGNLSA